MQSKVYVVIAIMIIGVFTSSAKAPADGLDPQRAAPHGELKGPIVALAWNACPVDTKYMSPFIVLSPNGDHPTPQEAAKESLAKPPHRAALFLPHDLLPKNDFDHNPADAPAGTPADKRDQAKNVWYDAAKTEARTRITKYLTEYKAAGGRLDYLVLDHEGAASIWEISPDALKTIWNDPRSAAFRKSLSFDKPDGVFDLSNRQYLEWNAATWASLAEALDYAVLEPVQQLYPNACVSNFENYVLTRGNVVPELNGHMQYMYRKVGTHAAPAFYGAINNLRNISLDGKHPYGDSPFAALRLDVNRMRAIKRSSSDPVSPWVGYKNMYELKDGAHSVLRSPYYEEELYHIALCGATEFLYFNPHPWYAGQDPSEWCDDAQDRLTDACLVELNSHLGNALRSPITLEQIAWDSPLVVTGMRIGDKSLWRVTTSPGITKVKVEPSGAILETNGAVGIWYTAKANDRPQFTPLVDQQPAAPSAR